MKLCNIIAISVLLFLLIAPSAQAAQLPNCQFIFGGGASCEQNSPITINKFVQNPESKLYVDSLLPSDPQYKAGDTVVFKLTLNNPTNAAINNIEVSDVFPPYINYQSGQGTFNTATRTFTVTIDQLKSKESRDIQIEGQIVANNQLPDDQFNRCIINQARVNANNKISQDNSIICLSKETSASAFTNNPTQSTKGNLQIYPPSRSRTTPPTGPEDISILSIAAFGFLGFFLRNKAKT